MEPFITQLAKLCAAHPTRTKWVFVPGHAIGHTIGDRLVLEGTNWANVRFVTPLDLALRMGAPFLVEQGIDPSEEGLGPALMMRLLLALPEEGGYFRPLAGQPQMAVALWSTIRELRLAGVSSTMLRADAFASAAKHAELVALLAAYETFLRENRRGDQATVFEEAARHADWCPIKPTDCWVDMPDVLWSPLQRRFLDALPGERIAPAAIALPGVATPRRLAAGKVERVAPGADVPLAFLTDPQHYAPKPKATAPAITLFHAGGAEAEVEEVFSRILASGESLDQAEIACATPQYATLLWEKAIRYEWPVTVAQGIPAAMTRPGRALLSMLEWVEDDFAAGRLRRMLQSGDIRLSDDVSASSARAARLLVKAQAAWGRDTYRLALGRLAKSARAGARRDDYGPDRQASLEKQATQAEELARWINIVIALVPANGMDGLIDLQQMVTCAHAFVDRFSARSNALDALAAKSLCEAIAELRALTDFRCSLDHALHFVRERIEGVTVGADRPRPGHLHISSLSTAGLAGRPQMFVVGLEEGRVFPAPFEDPILLDAERAAIDAALARSTDRTDEAVFAALSRLAAMSGHAGTSLSLSYSGRDLREYRQTYASWLLLQSFRVVSREPKATYQDLHDHLDIPKSCVPVDPHTALGESRWWLHGVVKGGARANTAVMRAYPSLGAGVGAEKARESASFTEFDGHVPAAGPVLDPCAPNTVVSPTQLEGAAQCPFRHFLRRGLGVEAIEGGDRDRDVWLDALLRGSLLHDLYADLMRRCRSEKRRATLPVDAEWLRKRGEDRLIALAVEMPPPSEEVRDRETGYFLHDLALFVEAEANLDASRTPVGFEVAFGQSGHGNDPEDEAEVLAQPDPIVIDAGDVKIRIAGRIDRIDRIDRGGQVSYEIVDYKTGGYWADDWKGTFAKGTRLQHALYGLAALELLKRQDGKAQMSGAEYYFSSAKGQQERKRIATQSLAKISDVLGDLRKVIASGLYVHAPDMKACRWCNYGYACGGDAARRAAAKIADPNLAPFMKLAEHE